MDAAKQPNLTVRLASGIDVALSPGRAALQSKQISSANRTELQDQLGEYGAHRGRTNMAGRLGREARGVVQHLRYASGEMSWSGGWGIGNIALDNWTECRRCRTHAKWFMLESYISHAVQPQLDFVQSQSEDSVCPGDFR